MPLENKHSIKKYIFTLFEKKYPNSIIKKGIKIRFNKYTRKISKIIFTLDPKFSTITNA